jgi:hypothetical protein
MEPIFVHRNLWRCIEYGIIWKHSKRRYVRFVRLVQWVGAMLEFDCSPVQKYIFADCCICVRIGHHTFVDKHEWNRLIWTPFGHEGQE